MSSIIFVLIIFSAVIISYISGYAKGFRRGLQKLGYTDEKINEVWKSL